MVLTKQQLADILTEWNIDFPPTATVAQLKALKDSVEAERAAANAPPRSEDDSDDDPEQDGAYGGIGIPPSGTLATSAERLDRTMHYDRGGRLVPPVVASLIRQVSIPLPRCDATVGPVIHPEHRAETAPVHRVSSADTESADLDRELTLLRKRTEIERLKRELDDMQGDRDSYQSRRHVDFSELSTAVPSFSGDDTYSIRKWISDFEDVTSSVRCDEKVKYLSARRLLTGTAKLFLRTIHCTGYAELRSRLLKEFDVKTVRRDVYQLLGARRKSPKESCLHYVLSMPIEQICRMQHVLQPLLPDRPPGRLLQLALPLQPDQPLVHPLQHQQSEIGSDASIVPSLAMWLTNVRSRGDARRAPASNATAPNTFMRSARRKWQRDGRSPLSRMNQPTKSR